MTVERQAPNADEKLFALLSLALAPIVSIIMLVLEDKRKSKFISYAAYHGVAVGLIGYLVSSFTVPILGIGFLIGLAVFVYQVYLGYQAYNGVWITVPYVTDFLANQGWIEAPVGVEVAEVVETASEAVEEEAAEIVEEVKEEAAEIVEEVEEAAESIEPEE